MTILRPYGPSRSERRRTAQLFGSSYADASLIRTLRRDGAPWASGEDDGAFRIGRAVACRCYTGPLKGPYTGLAMPCSLVGLAHEGGLVVFLLTENSASTPRRRTYFVAPEDVSRGGTRQRCPTLVWHEMQIALPEDDEPSATWFLNGWLELLPPGQQYASINAHPADPMSWPAPRSR